MCSRGPSWFDHAYERDLELFISLLCDKGVDICTHKIGTYYLIYLYKKL